MRIVFVLNIATPYRDPLLTRLGGLNGVHLTVMYCSRKDPMRQWEPRAKRFDSLYLSGINIGGGRGGFRWRFNPGISRTLSRIRPDLVVVGGYVSPSMQLTIRWCVRNKTPFLLLSESHDLRTRSSVLKNRIKGFLLRNVTSKAQGFLAASPSAASYLIKWGAKRESIFLFPNAPDIDGLRRNAWARSDAVEKFRLLGSPTLLFVGRLIEVKNIETLLKAFARIKQVRPSAHLVIAGSGPREGELKRQMDSLNLEGITIMGFVSQRDLPSLYSLADLLLLPSSYEPFGVVILESLALGTPVIVSENVGAKDLVKQGINGYVLPPTDPELWAQTVVDATDPAKLRDLNKGAEAIGLPWNYDFCLRNFRAAMQMVLESEVD